MTIRVEMLAYFHSRLVNPIRFRINESSIYKVSEVIKHWDELNGTTKFVYFLVNAVDQSGKQDYFRLVYNVKAMDWSLENPAQWEIDRINLAQDKK